MVGDATGHRVRFGRVLDASRDGCTFVDVEVTIDAGSLHVTSLVQTVEGAGGLAAFLRSLAEDWRGWTGERTWESLERTLTIGARHEPLGHVVLTFTLREHHVPDPWIAAAPVRIAAGEDLRSLAEALTDHLERVATAGRSADGEAP